MLLVCLGHRSSSRLWRKYSVVSVGLQLRQKETVELFSLHFLQRRRQYRHQWEWFSNYNQWTARTQLLMYILKHCVQKTTKASLNGFHSACALRFVLLRRVGTLLCLKWDLSSMHSILCMLDRSHFKQSNVPTANRTKRSAHAPWKPFREAFVVFWTQCFKVSV